tara:strand:- start:25 stop:240 length:216 start_codon:yes stop_codon:yes gene_type:complete
MEKIIKPIKINRSNFNTYGDLISTNDINPIDINAGYAKRFDNLANLNTSKDGGKSYSKYLFCFKANFPYEN